jgi:steroid 5-alpha reductase family enzyme
MVKTRSVLLCLAAYCVAMITAGVVVRLSVGLSPVWTAGLADLAATLIVFAFSVGLNNSSVYDPYWSVAPPVITLWWLTRFGGIGGVTAIRQIAVSTLVVVWATRLTWNWLRRWNGLMDEDWRYADYRRLGAGYWLVSFFGFHMMPTVLVFVSCLSLVPALSSASRGIGILDVLGIVVVSTAILVEASADRQLRTFRARRKAGEILDTGLWALSRHPNYFGEVLFWWGLWIFGIAADPSRWWTIVGPAGVTALFLGISVPMMDKRMLSRHPDYATHICRRSAFIPWLTRQ